MHTHERIPARMHQRKQFARALLDWQINSWGERAYTHSKVPESTFILRGFYFLHFLRAKHQKGEYRLAPCRQTAILQSPPLDNAILKMSHPWQLVEFVDGWEDSSTEIGIHSKPPPPPADKICTVHWRWLLSGLITGTKTQWLSSTGVRLRCLVSVLLLGWCDGVCLQWYYKRKPSRSLKYPKLLSWH